MPQITILLVLVAGVACNPASQVDLDPSCPSEGCAADKVFLLQKTFEVHPHQAGASSNDDDESKDPSLLTKRAGTSSDDDDESKDPALSTGEVETMEITIGKSDENNKCINASEPVKCDDDAGNEDKRVNEDPQYPDTFQITSNGKQVCAKRTDPHTDSDSGWHMTLKIRCDKTCSADLCPEHYSLKANAGTIVGRDQDTCCDAICKCTTPNTGTVDHNQYTCTDGTSAYCATSEVCYATTPFAKSESVKQSLCRTACSCVTPNTGTVDHNQYTCTDGTSAYCATSEVCSATTPFVKSENVKQSGCSKEAANAGK